MAIQLPILALVAGVSYVAYEVRKQGKKPPPALPPGQTTIPMYTLQDPGMPPGATAYDDTSGGGGGDSGGGGRSSGSSSYGPPPVPSAEQTGYVPVVASVPATVVQPVQPSAEPKGSPTQPPVTTTSLSNPFANPRSAVEPGTPTTSTAAPPPSTSGGSKFTSSIAVPTFSTKAATAPIAQTSTTPQSKPLANLASGAGIYRPSSNVVAPIAKGGVTILNPIVPAAIPAVSSGTKGPSRSSGKFAGDPVSRMIASELGEFGSDWLPTFVTPDDAKNYIKETDASWFRLSADVETANVPENIVTSWRIDAEAWKKFRDENLASVGYLNTKATMEATDRWLLKANQWKEYLTKQGVKTSGPGPLPPEQGDPNAPKGLSSLQVAGLGAGAALAGVIALKALKPF